MKKLTWEANVLKRWPGACSGCPALGSRLLPGAVAVQLGVLSAAVPEVGGSCVAADSSGGHDGQHVTWESSPGENSLRGFGDTQLAVTQPPPCRLGTVRGDS